MIRSNRARFLALVLLILGAGAPRAFAQDVTTRDLERVQDDIDRVSGNVADLRSRDGRLASDLERQLDRVRDDLAYLRVKLRRNEPISGREYDDVRDRVDDIRARARGARVDRARDPDDRIRDDRPNNDPGDTRDAPDTLSSDALPVDTEFDVRLQTSLSSATARVEDRFDATTVVDVRRGDRVIVPAGAIVHGMVSAVTKTTRIERKGSLTLVFDRITIDGRSYPVRATVVQALESAGIKGEAGKIGIGAGVGAIIGGLLGGAKGAIAGILIGGGGTLAATEGKDVELPAGTMLRVRLDTPLDVTRDPTN